MKSNGRSDCQAEAKDLFAKLSSLREESYRQFYNIISCHEINISNGIRDLTEEVNGLQSELLVVRKAKSVLLETIGNLNGEIRQLNAKLESIKQPEEEPDRDIIKGKVPNGESCEATQIDQVLSETRIKTVQNIGTGYEPVINQVMKEENQHPINKDHTVTDSTHDKVGDKDEAEDIDRKENVARDKSVCPECKFEFSTNENMNIHMKNIHSELRSDHEKGESETNQSVDKHRIMRKQSKIKKHSCELCPFVSKEKKRFEMHMVSVHKIGEAKFKCHLCPFMSLCKPKLDRHMVSKHKIGEAKFKCGQCAFASFYKRNFDGHMLAVHKIGEAKFKCELCSHISRDKTNLQVHIKNVHKRMNRLID